VTGQGIVIRDAAVGFLAAGGRDLPLSMVRDPGAGDPGRAVRLVHPSGSPLGLAVADVENDRVRLFARADEPFAALDAGFFAARVDHALALRRTLGLAGDGAAYRLIHGAGDGLPGLEVDVYHPFAVVFAYGRALLPLARQLAEAVRAYAGCRGAVVKLRSRGAAGRQQVAREVVGEAPPEKLVVAERGLRFEIHPTAGLNAGLFTDMREHRHRLGELAAGRRVLNGFAYTGSLSLACARGGAAAVTSVDLSSGVLRWAEDNLRLNGIDPAARSCRTVASDVGRFLGDAARGGDRWDLILLDPPTWSAARGARFSIERDYPQLVARACAVADGDALLWLAANTRGVALVDIARAGFRRAGCDAVLLETGGLPADHPTLPAQPDDRYLQTGLFRVAATRRTPSRDRGARGARSRG